MSITPILVIALPVLVFLAAGLVGSTRRLGFWWTLLLSLLVTPVGGFIVAVLSGPRRPKEPEPAPYGLPPPE
jgi:UPF0716 family protein affecting phage T7 exclusion